MEPQYGHYPDQAQREPAELSGAVQEIMGRPPSWIVRWGMVVFAGIIGCLLFISWLISYPDTIESPIVVTGVNPPVGVVARKDGHLEHLVVKEKQSVKEGDILALIAGPADARRVLRLKSTLAKLVPFISDQEAFINLPLEAETNLGQLQTAYATFHSNYTTYGTALKDDYTSKTLINLKAQLKQKTEQLSHLADEGKAVNRELLLVEERYRRMEALHNSESVSLLELQEAEEARLDKQRLYASVRSRILEEEIALSTYKQEIRDLEYKRTDSLRTLRQSLRESLKNLLSEIEVWESDYVLRAPISGAVAFYEFWSDQQFVQADKEVFIIVPESSTLVGRMSIKDGGTGKVMPGQSVRIRFADYPHKEFGVVFGSVKALSLVPRQGVHQVTVALDYPLKTSYGKELPFKQDMTGDGSIVTKKIRLLGRIFFELRKIFADQ